MNEYKHISGRIRLVHCTNKKQKKEYKSEGWGGAIVNRGVSDGVVQPSLDIARIKFTNWPGFAQLNTRLFWAPEAQHTVAKMPSKTKLVKWDEGVL